MDFFLGVLTALFVVNIGISVYCHWRYNYAPWKVMRRDVTALAQQIHEQNSRIADIKNEQGLRKATTLTDEQVAKIERQQRMDLLRSALDAQA